MKTELFFDPVQISVDSFKENTMVHCADIFIESTPQWNDVDIVVFGVATEGDNHHQEALSKIRNQFYSLKSSGRYKLADLGNLRNAHSLEETYLRMKEVCEHLHAKDKWIIILGGTHDFDFGQFAAYEEQKDFVNMVTVDAYLDMEDGDPSQSHTKKILLHEPNILFDYCHLGYQSYFVDRTMLATLDKLNFKTLRIGEMRDRFEKVEPIIRGADLLSFDLTAIKSTDIAVSDNTFGLTGEEACRICWYAGMSHQLSSIGLYGFTNQFDNKSATTVAIMMWYAIDGYYNKRGSLDYTSSQYRKYLVAFVSEPGEIVFYKDTQSEKWWVEVPVFNKTTEKLEKEIIPCEYKDYQQANEGELPEIWIRMESKYK